MEEQESSAPNFIPKDLLDIICILERDERHHSYKIVRNRTGFSLIAKFGAKNVEMTPLKRLWLKAGSGPDSAEATENTEWVRTEFTEITISKYRDLAPLPVKISML